MKHKYLVLTLGCLIASAVLLLISCKKINEATTLGEDLIPPIDNVTTFDTTITVQAFNDKFTILDDSSRSLGSDEQFLGLINNDPLFGRTDARMFFEFKPPYYRFSFMQTEPDSLHLDSVVLVLNYLDTYGDKTIPQTINVYEMDQSNDFNIDSAYLIRNDPFVYTNLLGSKTFTPQSLSDSVKAYKDTTASQLRIRLDNSFGQRLLLYDSVGPSGAYYSDSAFRTKFKGFALKSVGGGNAIMGFSLTGANSKLAIYYRYNRPNSNDKDTTVAYFTYNTILGSASANYIGRDYTGTTWWASSGDQIEDDLVYIQNTPGTFARIKIPALSGLGNRIVHRAELLMEQVYNGTTDTMFYNPPTMFVDAWDPSISKYRTIPYDFALSTTGAGNYTSFGSFPQNGVDPSGNAIKKWNFNLTRYVQHVLNGTLPLYELRLFSPVLIVDQYGIPGGVLADGAVIVQPYSPVTFAKGRVRLGGGNHATQRMRLRIIYSKI